MSDGEEVFVYCKICGVFLLFYAFLIFLVGSVCRRLLLSSKKHRDSRDERCHLYTIRLYRIFKSLLFQSLFRPKFVNTAERMRTIHLQTIYAIPVIQNCN